MRIVLLLAAASMGCTAARIPTTPSNASTPVTRPSALVEKEAAPEGIPFTALGAADASGDWIELAMPDDARVLSFSQKVNQGQQETWTMTEHGARRVLRVRLEGGGKIGHAAYAGTVGDKGAIDLRLVEVTGNVRYAPERAQVTCTHDRICEDGKPSHRVAVAMCTFADDENGGGEVLMLAPGKGVDFPVGSCPQPTPPPMPQRRSYGKGPRLHGEH